MITEVDYSNTKILAAICLGHAAERLSYAKMIDSEPVVYRVRDYHDFKAKQLLDLLHDQLVLEAKLEAWFADLGFDGQCGT